MMSRLRRGWKTLFASGGLRGPVLTLFSGTAVALVLSYLAQPVLTRLYTPEDFGVFDTFVSVVGLLVPFASFRYEDALMLPERDEEAAGVLWLAFVLLLVVTLVSGLLVFGRVVPAGAGGFGQIVPWLLWLPPILFAMRLTRLSEVWLTRRQAFGSIARANVALTVTTTATRIGAGLTATLGGPLGLIAGLLVGQSAGALILGRQVLHRSGRLLRSAWDPAAWPRLARRYRRFPLFSVPATFLSTLNTRLPFLLLLFFFDERIVGWFGRAFAAVMIPLSLIGNAFGQVFYVQGAEARRTGTLAGLTERVHGRLVMLSLGPAFILAASGPDLFAVVFGAPWRTAGEYARYLALWLALTGTASPLTRLFDILEKQRTDLLTTLFLFALQATALVAGGLSGSIRTAILLLGGVGSLARVLQLVILLGLAGVPGRAALRPYLRYGAVALACGLLPAATLWVQRPWLTALAAGLAGIVYLSLLVVLDPGLRASIKDVTEA